MLLNTKKNQGLTLIELLIATAIMGIISLSSVRLLWGTLATRAKQHSIETSSDSSRFLISTITEAIQSSQSIGVSSPFSSSITIKGTPCRIIRLNGNIIEQAIDDNVACNPVTFKPMNQPEISLQNLKFSPQGTPPKAIKIEMSGVYKDSVTDHPFNYSTTVSVRNL